MLKADSENEDWIRGEQVFIILEQDEEGFAKIKSYQREAPTETDYIKITVRSTYGNTLRFSLPFNRYYMVAYSPIPQTRRAQKGS